VCAISHHNFKSADIKAANYVVFQMLDSILSTS